VPWAPPMVLVVLALGVAVGQVPTDREILDRFRSVAHESPSGRRVEAARDLLDLRDPALVPEILQRVLGVAQSLERQEARLEGLCRRVAAAESARDRDPGRRDRHVDLLATLEGDLSFVRADHHWSLEEMGLLRRALRRCLQEAGEPRLTTLLEELVLASTRAPGVRARIELMRVLGEFPRADVGLALVQALKAGDPRIRLGALAALGRQSLPESEAAILPFLEAAEPAYRLAALRALRGCGGAATVGALIRRLGIEKGLLLDETLLTLERLAGLTFHESVPLWTEWWDRARPGWRRPEESRSAAASPGAASYYGISFRAQSLVYAIDVSGSMKEPARGAGTTGSGPRDETKLERAKRELLRSLDSLAPGTRVNVIAYSDRVHPFAPELLALDEGRRRSLRAWVQGLQASGETNIGDTLEWILRGAQGRDGNLERRLRVETVFLLTDGVPTAGRLRTASELAHEVARLNELPMVVVHTIGIGPDHSRDLLRRIAEVTGGQYRAAD
jgi:hypothetical protein